VIPGKQYKPEDIVEALWRRRWVIVLPLVVISAVTITVAQLLPDRYRSETVLLIVPQRVPENYVRPTVTTRLDERLQSIRQQILSRTRLERVIQDFELYRNERERMIMEDVIELMRRDVKIGASAVRADGGSFVISYQSNDPRLAMLVTERLATMVINENLADRSVFADMTDQFLSSQLDDARRQLMEHERKLEAFRRANEGKLPEQFDANQQAMMNTQMQLQALQETISRDRDRQLMLHRMMNDLASASANAAGTGSEPGPVPAARQLEAARTALRNLEMRLKADHPDIRALKRAIRDLEQKAAAEALQQPVSATASVSPADTARQSKLTEYQAESDTIDRRIATKQNEERRLMGAMAGYRARLEAAPGLESELTALMRDYDTLQRTYQTLLAKGQEAKVAANMERRQIGEQFKIIDNARLPQRPTSPNRMRINLLGALFGLVVGVGLAALLEYRDSSLRSEEDVLVALSLPVLALVPTMATTEERHKRRRQRLLLASSAGVFFLVSVTLLAWKFRVIAEWAR
jgi:polysaccharide chain length determinant protein (PEP-CTERM system associated)